MKAKEKLAEIEKFVDTHGATTKDLKFLITRCKALEAALEFYAVESNYSAQGTDIGSTARKALEVDT